MDGILAFFSTLILVTAGIVVCLLWLALFVAIGIEVWDGIKGNNGGNEEDEELYQ